jgi:putative hydrolase of the HAD superfamily
VTPAAVLLDLDATLVDTPAAMRVSVVAALERLVGDLSAPARTAVQERWVRDPNGHFLRYENGEISFADQRRARYAEVATLAGAPTGDGAYAAWERVYVAGLTSTVRAFDDVEPFLDALGSIPVAVVTNVTTDVQRAKLVAAGLAERLPVVVGVDVAGAPKPDPAPFRHACAVLDVEPAAAVHIGDSLLADVVGAHRAGLRAIWLDRAAATPDATRPTLPPGACRVTTLTEAAALFATWSADDG